MTAAFTSTPNIRPRYPVIVFIHGESYSWGSGNLYDGSVLAAVGNWYEALYYASDDLRSDRDVVMHAVKHRGRALFYARGEEIFDDREILFEAIKTFGCAVMCASPRLRADRELVIKAVAQDGCALEYATEELRADRGVVLAAVGHHGGVLRYAAKHLRSDPEILAAADARPLPL